MPMERLDSAMPAATLAMMATANTGARRRERTVCRSGPAKDGICRSYRGARGAITAIAGSPRARARNT